MAVYRFIAGEKATADCSWTIAEMCRTLEVSRSGFYDWAERPPCAAMSMTRRSRSRSRRSGRHRIGPMGHRGCIGGCAATAFV